MNDKRREAFESASMCAKTGFESEGLSYPPDYDRFTREDFVCDFGTQASEFLGCVERAEFLIVARLGDSDASDFKKEIETFRAKTEEMQSALQYRKSDFYVMDLCSKSANYYRAANEAARICRCYFYIYWHKADDENKVGIERELIEAGLSALRFWRWEDMQIDPPVYGENDPLFAAGSPLLGLAISLEGLHSYEKRLENVANLHEKQGAKLAQLERDVYRLRQKKRSS